MRLEDLADASVESLEVMAGTMKSRDAASTTEYERFRRAYIRIHATRVATLAKDVLLLVDAGRKESAPLVLRGALECLFSLGAAVKKPLFAGSKVVYDDRHAARCQRAAAKTASDPQLKTFLTNQAQANDNSAETLAKRHNIVPEKWPTSACAGAAELGRLYVTEYALLSEFTHTTTVALLIQREWSCLAPTLRTTAKVVLDAAGFLTESGMFEIDEASEHRASELREQLNELERKGAIEALYYGEMCGLAVVRTGRSRSRFQAN